MRRGVFRVGYFEKQLWISVSKGVNTVTGGTQAGLFQTPASSVSYASFCEVYISSTETSLYVECFSALQCCISCGLMSMYLCDTN